MIQKLALTLGLLGASQIPAVAQQPQHPGDAQFDCTAFKPEGGSVYQVTKPTVIVWGGQSYRLRPGQTFNLDELKVDPGLLRLMHEHCKK